MICLREELLGEDNIFMPFDKYVMRHLIQLLEEKSKPQDIEIIPLNFTPNEVSLYYLKIH